MPSIHHSPSALRQMVTIGRIRHFRVPTHGPPPYGADEHRYAEVWDAGRVADGTQPEAIDLVRPIERALSSRMTPHAPGEYATLIQELEQLERIAGVVVVSRPANMGQPANVGSKRKKA